MNTSNQKYAIWAGSPKPRSASKAFFTQNASESECITGRDTERHLAVKMGTK